MTEEQKGRLDVEEDASREEVTPAEEPTGGRRTGWTVAIRDRREVKVAL